MSDRYIADNYIKDVVNIGYKELNNLAQELAEKDLEIFFRKVISNGVNNCVDTNLIEVKKLYLLLYYELTATCKEEYNSLLESLMKNIKYDVNIEKGKSNYLYHMNCNEIKEGIEFYESLGKKNIVFAKSLENLKDYLNYFEIKYKIYTENNNYDENSFKTYLSNNKDVVEKFILMKLKSLIYTNCYSVNDHFISEIYPKGTIIKRSIDSKRKGINLRYY